MRQRTVSPLRMMRQRKRKSTKLTQTRTTTAAAATTTTVTTTMMCVLQQQQEAKPRALAQLNTTQVVPLNTIPPQLQQQNSRTSAPSVTLYERNKIAVVMRFFFVLFSSFSVFKQAYFTLPYKTNTMITHVTNSRQFSASESEKKNDNIEK